MTLKIHSEILPRYSCATHKLNLVMRNAIRKNKELYSLTKKLSAFAASSKAAVHLSAIHIEKKCKLKMAQGGHLHI